MPVSLIATIRQHANGSGFDLFGVVDAARFDACQPKEQRITALRPTCGTVLVVGSGGAQRDPHATRLGIQRIVSLVQNAHHRMMVIEPGRSGVSFSRLAEAAGFGTVSPVTGLLLHPEFGPWVRIHAALLVDGQPFGVVPDAAISDHFQPCCRCRQPCLETQSPPALACPLGEEHRDHGAARSPQYAGTRTGPMWRIAMSALRFMPRYLRW